MSGEVTYREALRSALRAALRDDERVIVLGQDVGVRGGAYGVTAGLLEDFGAGRILDAPSSEAAIVGVAIGAAMTGMRPVVELTTATFAGLAYDQLAHHAAPLRAMSGGRVHAPFVLRMPQSAGARLGPVHSSNVEALLHHIPGLTVWAPATPADAGAMLRAAIATDDPVVLLEHTLLYDTVGPPPPPPGDAAASTFGATVRRTGADVTLVATSRMVDLALGAADRLAEEEIHATVIDLRSLRPLDDETVRASATSTGAAILIEEGPPAGGITATLSALLPRSIAIERVTGADAPTPYAAALEAAALPSLDRIVTAARALVGRGAAEEDDTAVVVEPSDAIADPGDTSFADAPTFAATAPAFTTTAPVDVEGLLAARRRSSGSLAALLADAVEPLLETAIIIAEGDTIILGQPAPGPAPATLTLGPIATRPTVADGAVTIRHVAPLTLHLAAATDGPALFASLRERVAAN
ncbi:alpha-ketoacid dehydrogenase subunit beta [Baekduia sp. Peel2402]|uniref:alpha-ketoacid dehydrogenase subunit beta n=1 Tax=Baekduia sp. Peel2402 TaxID=3458296 RepID=UPI00403E4A26